MHSPTDTHNETPLTDSFQRKTTVKLFLALLRGLFWGAHSMIMHIWAVSA